MVLVLPTSNLTLSIFPTNFSLAWKNPFLSIQSNSSNAQ
jgi:hypothetical protein